MSSALSVDLTSNHGLAIVPTGETLAAAETFRSMFENLVEGIFQTTPAGQYLNCNPALARIYGYESPLDLMRGLNDISQQLYVKPRRRDEFKTLIERDGIVTDFESEIHRKDGSIIWISENSRAIFDRHGKVVCYEGTVMDITRRKQAEAELETAQQQLIEAARRDGMAEIATGVLHNVGNVLNSVNVAANVLTEQLQASKLSDLSRGVQLMLENRDHLGEFITGDARGKHLPDFFQMAVRRLEQENAKLLEEVAGLAKNIDHIKTIVAMQQSYAGVSGTGELVSLAELLDDALALNGASFERHGIGLIREYEDLPQIIVEKQKLLQILVNLLKNAKDAVSQMEKPCITLRIRRLGADRVTIEVRDNGVGIPTENLTRIFSHGFTTKRDGHGFGLHASANTARQLGGSLTAMSDGPRQGSTFVVELSLSTEGGK